MRGTRTPLDKRPLGFYPAPNDRKNTGLNSIHIDDIVDAEMRGDKIYFITTTGDILETRSSPMTRDLYWEIKLRNRRKAFGL